MKYFDLKCIDMRAFRVVIILGMLGGIVLTAFTFVRLMARYGEIGALAPFLAVLFVLFFLKRFLKKEYRAGISAEELVLFKKGSETPAARIRMADIAMIRHRIQTADDFLRIFRRGETTPAIKISTFNQSGQIHELLVEINRHADLVQTKGGDGWDEYVSKAAAQSVPQNIQTIRKQQKNPKGLLIVLGVVFLLSIGSLVLLATKNEGDGYLIGVHQITYDGVPLDIDREQAEMLGASIVKDSSRVYFYGELVTWADAPTFEEIGRTFFRDRNGLYREQLNLLSRNKLVPLTGDFDPQTLTGVDNVFYKDKDHVYYFDFNFGSGKKPLKRVDVEGIDPASFEALNHIWFRDANAIYFGGWADFRRAEEIDAGTFEVLTWQVAKDKNNVYYLTRNLSSEGERATERDNYAVLKGAHAPSFTMIDIRTFKDENTVWTIGDPDAREPAKYGKPSGGVGTGGAK